MSKLFIAVLLLTCLVDSLTAKKIKDSKDKKPGKRRIADIVEDLEQKVSELFDKVEQLSNPVHVHVHGDGHVMEDCQHGNHLGHNHSAHSDKKYHMGHPHDDDDDKRHHMGHPHDDDDDKRHHMGHPHDDDDDKRHHMGHPHDDDDKHKVHNHTDHHRNNTDNDAEPRHRHPRPVKGRLNNDDSQDVDSDDKMQNRKKEKTAGRPMSDQSSDGNTEEDFHHDPKGAHVHIHLHTGPVDHPHHHHHDDHDEDSNQQRGSLPKEYRYAKCDMVSNSALPSSQHQNISGCIYFRQKPGGPLDIELDLQGFQLGPGATQKHLRAMHCHEYGDMSEGCASMGGHFNPWGRLHGGPESQHRHAGDFGNIEVEQDGTSDTSFSDFKGGSLFAEDSLLGRGIVIHAGQDDHGTGKDEASKQSGNAGPRIACCVIVATSQHAAVWDD